MKDPNVTKKLATCGKLSDVNVSEYDAIFYVGGKVQVPRLGVSPVPIRIVDVRSTGHGPMIDLSKDTKNAELIAEVRLPPLR